MVCGLKFHWYLRILSPRLGPKLKFSCLCPVFTTKVLKYPRNCRLHAIHLDAKSLLKNPESANVSTNYMLNFDFCSMQQFHLHCLPKLYYFFLLSPTYFNQIIKNITQNKNKYCNFHTLKKEC